MFNSKNKYSKIASSVLMTALLLAFTISFSPLTKANVGQDFLAGIGCDDKNKDGGLNFFDDCLSGDNKGTVTSFTDFKGDLSAPNPEGYAPGLTQAQDARTFILNVTNFALGFLGLLAVLVIVYGGVLNVTAAGDPGKADKGKKAISFAVIGLLIVMSSFAIVNTVLLAPSGSEKGSSSTIGSTTTIRGVASNQRFNYLSDQIEKALQKVYSSYQFHFTAKQEIDNTIASLDALKEGNCFVPASDCANQYANAFQTSYVTLSNLINDSNANAKFTTGMSAYLTNIANEYNKKITSVRTLILSEDCDTENTFIDAGNPCTPDNLKEIKSELNSAVSTAIASLKNAEFINQSATEDLDSALATTANVFQAVSGLASANIGLEYFKKLIPTFADNPDGTAPTALSAEGSDSSFVKLNNILKTQLKPGTSLEGIDQADIKSVLSNLIQIASVLKNIKFVNTVISADIVKGNAPLIVNFSSIGTTDPSGRTIIPENIRWDLNGDGDFSGEDGEKSDVDLGLQNCDEKSGAIASCTFSKPGTYRISLKALPDTNAIDQATGVPYSQEIAPGISYIDILVSPPSTKINLEVASGTTKRPVIKYDGEGNLVEDHSQVYFTLSEAKAGLTFDATKSTLSDGTSQLINDPTAKIRWNFGVQSENNDTYQIPSKDKLSLTQAYPATGNYQVKFEVTDKNGVVDRKIFTVVVANLAPRISNPPLSGKVGDEVIVYDGSDSTSDGGPIIFNWRIEKLAVTTTASLKSLFAFNLTKSAHAALGTTVGSVSAVSPSVSAAASKLPSVITVPPKTLEPTKRLEENDAYKCFMPEDKDDTLKCNFKKAGTYKITLSLDDNGTPREESVLTVVSSTAPTASFKMQKLTPSAPALYKLDASSLSFDPDEKDNSGLEYSWEMNPSNCNVIGFADQSSEGELIRIASDATSAQIPCAKLKEFSHTYSQPVVKFTQKGDYAIGLTVRSFDEPSIISETAEQPLTIDNVLDIAWGNMKPSAILKVQGETTGSSDQLPENVNKEPQAEIKFIFVSSQAISYELDFGDGNSDSGDMTANVPKEVPHSYSKTGKFVANLSVFDADDIENKLSRKIFIGNSETPVAIITTIVNGNEAQPEDVQLDNGRVVENVIKVNRADNISFDAEKSLNTDGTARRLLYSWNINSNDKQATTKQVSYKFTELSDGPEPYIAKLKVTNERDPAQVGEDTVNIMVVGEQPTLRSLTAVAAGSDNTTPTQVKLTAVGAEDEDGQIVQYKWWYYDADSIPSPDERKGLQITTVPTATLTLGTNGEEGQKKRYRFGVEMTDNDNITVSTDNQNDASRLTIIPPQVEVVNGPNKAPISKFTVDRTSINLGESVNFTSSSIDPDKGGSIKEYRWDFGDGTKGENKSSVSHTYQKANVEGYKAKLTVVDNNSSEATSDPIRIFVDANAQPPVPGFTFDQTLGSKTVKFSNSSTSDSAAGAKLKKYSWDFDIGNDSNGDGKKDNDIDSGDQNPSYTYPNFGIYRAKLTVEDDQGQSRSITNFVNVKPAAPAVKPTGTSTTNSSANSSSSASKTVGANLFEASTRVDTGLLLASIGAYAILFLVSRKKQQDTKNKIN